jgi:hypothetical protein
LARAQDDPGQPALAGTAALVFDVADLPTLHPLIRAEDFRAPLIRRLLPASWYEDGEALIEDSHWRRPHPEECGSVIIRWSGLQKDFERCMRTYQDAVITEKAALGLACILVRHRAKLEITEVTCRGGKADYWPPIRP